MICGIYIIYNSVNEHIYLGSSKNIKHRWNQHRHSLNKNKHHSKYLQRSWDKYKENSFIFSIIEICTEDKLQQIEQEYLDVCKPEYNLSPSAFSNRGYKWTEEQKKKKSKIHKGKPNPNKGKKTGKIPWNKGCSMSKESNFKLSNSLKGKRNSKSTEFKLGCIQNPEKQRQIKCIELDLIFKSVADAARFTGNVKNQSNILACSNGRQKTAYGYSWVFIY